MLMPRAVTKNKSYHHGDLGNALITLALEHIQRDGIAQLSVRKLSEEIGVSPGAAYRHFADKQSLLDALALLGFQMLGERMTKSIAKATTSQEKLEACGQAYVLFAYENPDHFRLMFEGIDPANTKVYIAFKQLAAILQEVLGVIGYKNEMTKDELIGAVWSSVHGMSMLLVEHRLTWFIKNKKQVQDFVKKNLEVLHRGLK
jgi:AcrR family transcriptional regulator